MSIEGAVQFTIKNVVERFRYKVINNDNKLQFWIEDMKSKHQWQTREMEIKDFVDDKNIITNALMKDYIALFLDCLDGEEDGRRSMTINNVGFDKVGYRVLTWTVTLDMGIVTIPLKYSFSLQQISLDKFDLISAQMRDIVDDIAHLKNSLTTLQMETTKLNERVYSGESRGRYR